MILSSGAAASAAPLRDYARPRELDPLPPGMASLYRVPWRVRARTASAYRALQGIGVYWKHIALLPFQIDRHTHAVAAYIVSPNVAQPLDPIAATIQIDRRIAGPVAAIRPATEQRNTAAVARRGNATLVRFAIHDDVTWLRFAVDRGNCTRRRGAAERTCQTPCLRCSV